MEEPNAAKRTTLGVPAQRFHCRFDLGQFGHDASREALTSQVRSTQTDAMPAATQVDERSLSTKGRSRAVRRALMVVLALNALSAALKVGVGARTGALTVLGAALESLLDMLSNGVGILAVSIASRAPDDDHPYGHEKFETLGTLGIVVFLSISCFELLRQSVGALVGAHRVPELRLSDALLLLASLGVNLFVVTYERRRGRVLSSNLLLADAAHTASDILVTALAIASLVLSRFGYLRADAVLGVLVALLIAWSGYQILRDSIPILVDARAVEADLLTEIVRTIPGVAGVRSARSRRTASGHLFAEVTILVDGATTVRDAHEFTDQVERAIARELGTAEAIVHVEPA
jgi:cation diffusion facilitator family transporter